MAVFNNCCDDYGVVCNSAYSSFLPPPPPPTPPPPTFTASEQSVLTLTTGTRTSVTSTSVTSTSATRTSATTTASTATSTTSRTMTSTLTSTTTSTLMSTCSQSERGPETISLKVGGMSRQVVLYMPAGTQKWPLWMVMPGTGDTAKWMMDYIGLVQFAKEKQFGFVVLGGSGVGAKKEFNVKRHARPDPSGVDDVAYAKAVLDTLLDMPCIDAQRVHCAGYSNGGRFCSLLASEMSDRIASIATVAGLRYPHPNNAKRAVPILAFHGTSDWINPWAGNGNPEYWHESVLDAFHQWDAFNGCPVETTEKWIPIRGQAYKQEAKAGCRDAATVELVMLKGGGHTWPGSAAAWMTRNLGRCSEDVSANRMMWEFFSQHPMPTRSPLDGTFQLLRADEGLHSVERRNVTLFMCASGASLLLVCAVLGSRRWQGLRPRADDLESREIRGKLQTNGFEEKVYGEPYGNFKKRQKKATEEQMAVFEASKDLHARTEAREILVGQALAAGVQGAGGGGHSTVCGQECDAPAPDALPNHSGSAVEVRIAVLTASDRAAKGIYQDESGPAILEMVRSFSERSGALSPRFVHQQILADDEDSIFSTLEAWSESKACDLIITTGGTGFGPRDVTPEAWQTSFLEPHSILSRGLCGITRNQVIVINLPGNPAAVKQCLSVLLPVLPHALRMVKG
ncbi:unnamed protein product [Polarella glacialis]|uniref:molybdopterin molybdotransferase n=1 Tax=Polarella glacialis TaxID=89957 RepID=A0A813EIC7_POLGL|nr:unnamed protein product [Polarella glacialis]